MMMQKGNLQNKMTQCKSTNTIGYSRSGSVWQLKRYASGRARKIVDRSIEGLSWYRAHGGEFRHLGLKSGHWRIHMWNPNARNRKPFAVSHMVTSWYGDNSITNTQYHHILNNIA
ncbi:hypothetical protein YC2023_061292 [Brassica napus]